MDDVPRPRPLHLRYEKTRHGKLVWYVRQGDGPRIRLKAPFGSAEFQAEYLAALGGEPAKPVHKPRSGSLCWLWDRYRETTAWTELSVATRRQRENIMKHVLDAEGDFPFKQIKPKAIEAAKDRRRDTPAQARNFLDAMRGLFGWAYAAGYNDSDPTLGVKNPKRKKGEGFKAWTEDDVARYVARWPLGTRQYLWLHVLLYIGSRRGDAVTHGRQHVRNGVLTFITEKGKDRFRVEVTRRIEPELAAAIANCPTGDLAFICGERGQPLTKESFGNVFKEACIAAGIMDKSAHGLRKLSATIWAERGATTHELMAMYGWLTVQMAEHYTRAAARRKLALGAHDRLSGTAAERPDAAPEIQSAAPIKTTS